MPSNTITNPRGAYGQTPQWEAAYVEAYCAAAVARGDIVVFSFSTTTGEITAAKATTTTDLDFLFGVADETITAGKVGRIVIRGFAWVKVGGNTVANGDGCIRDGTTAAIGAPVTEDATTIAGQTMGVFLGAKGSSSPYPFANAAPVYLGKF